MGCVFADRRKNSPVDYFAGGSREANPTPATKCMGQKVFCLFDPFSYFLRQKLAILNALEFQEAFSFV